MQTTFAGRSVNPLVLFSLVLLIPMSFVLFSFSLIPALDVVNKSTQDVSFLRGENPQSVGMENYKRLGDDSRYRESLGFSFRLLLGRVCIVAFLPAVIGLLMGWQGWTVRGVGRVMLAAIVAFGSSLALIILWWLFWGTTWDFNSFDAPPFGNVPESLSLRTPDGARNSVALLDALLTMGVAVGLGSLFFTAVARGRELGGSVWKAGIGVWLIGLLVALMSVAKTFTVPFALTNGGPINSTMTLGLIFHQDAFMRFRLGYAAAQPVMVMIPVVLAAVGVWGLLTGLRLRLRYVGYGPAFTPTSFTGCFSLPLILVTGFGGVLLGLWGVWLVMANGGFGESLESLDVEWARRMQSTILVPWLTLWLIQIPLAYLATLTLGFFRPLGWFVSNLLFLPLLVLAFLPTETLIISWFMTAQQNEQLGKDILAAYPWLFGAVSLIVFKLYFDGAHDAFQEARSAGKSPNEAFMWRVFLPSLPIVLVVGALLSLWATQELIWSLVTIIAPADQPLSLYVLSVYTVYTSNRQMVSGLSVAYLLIFAVPFFMILAALQLLVIDRLALVAGKTFPESQPIPADAPAPVRREFSPVVDDDSLTENASYEDESA